MAEEQAAASTVRIEPIATLPVFLKLRGRRAILAGGTPPAAWKAELLAAAGAAVRVLAEDPCSALRALAAAEPGVTLVTRAWTPEDMQDAAVALAALEDDAEAARFRDAARAAGVPVNVIDKPAFCDFQFGTIVSRSPLLVGISTDGAAPVFGQAIRTRIEALLPQGLRAWAEAARDWRPSITARDLGFRERRRFWEAFARRALGSPDQAPTEADLGSCLEVALTGDGILPARVTLVGAGPGPSDAITLRAVGALQDADTVVHDEAVSPLVVGYARREAGKIAVPPDAPAAFMVERIAALATPGRHIVWLAAGNPKLCLAWRERAEALAVAGFEALEIEGLGQCRGCTPPCPAWRTAQPSAFRRLP